MATAMGPGAKRSAPLRARRARSPSVLLWAAALAALFLAAVPSAAGAHDVETRVEVTPAQVNPGETVEVTGADFAADAPMRVELLTAGTPEVLAEVTSDPTGALLATAVIPDDAPARYYELHVVTDSTVVAVGYVEVVGPESESTGSATSAGAETTSLMPVVIAALVAAAVAVLVLGARSRPRASRASPPRTRRR